MSQGFVLLTGATGLLGRACLPHLLLHYGPKQIIALVRRGRDTAELKRIGIRTVEVNLCALDLELPLVSYRALANATHVIIHCAADIRFGVPLAESRSVNLLGTENLLRFASRCSRLHRFAHTSTVYVVGGRSGQMSELPADPGQFFNTYQQSKFEAEQAVLASLSAVPAAVYRFSTMIYDCGAGCVSQFNYFHHLLRLAAANPLPAIPAQRTARVDLIASDWAARAFDFLLEERWVPGAIFHICAGARSSLTVGELFDSTFDILGLGENRPELLSADEFSDRASSILCTPLRRRIWRGLSEFLPHLNVDQTFACTHLSEAIGHREDLTRPDPKALFRNTLLYCLATQWGQLGCAQSNWPPQLEPVPAVHPKQ